MQKNLGTNAKAQKFSVILGFILGPKMTQNEPQKTT
jgi:hypothetical protein